MSSDSVRTTDESDSVRPLILDSREPAEFSLRRAPQRADVSFLVDVFLVEELKEASSPSRLDVRGSLRIRRLALSASISPSVMDRSFARDSPAATTASSFMAPGGPRAPFHAAELARCGSWDQHRQMSAK